MNCPCIVKELKINLVKKCFSLIKKKNSYNYLILTAYEQLQEVAVVLPDEKIINTLLNYSIGTLWIAKEDLLKERIPRYDQNSTRKGHPILSIALRKIVGNEKIPMLMGTTAARGSCILIYGVFNDDKTTYFGTIGRFNPRDFLCNKIVKNRRKPRLNEIEMNLLNEWMKERGLLK